MATERQESHETEEMLAKQKELHEKIGRVLDAKRYEKRYLKMQGFTENSD